MNAILTLAAVGATPRPEEELTANALAIQDVIVSGTIVLMVAVPSGLEKIKENIMF